MIWLVQDGTTELNDTTIIPPYKHAALIHHVVIMASFSACISAVRMYVESRTMLLPNTSRCEYW